ncbi:hypothetical protein HPP92_000161 [Vanilla planifolia]|uniref:Transmembrane protein n=1 Tax=Vanilla planifolia TaxID=51239 RepID=A0A835S016_VANPL|nr:hypothetical protein HPP92_000110 [Vanilla planifolia]KAG0500068.1 hypothetical protein HPP92_000140 [Vanilla planifolia]KAG0500089.1 hypothetical protein HPP92_000161 [Vanilla planifolia]
MKDEAGGTAMTPPPHVVLLLVVTGALVAAPFLFGEGGSAVTEAISDVLTPAGLLLLPVVLVLLIRFLSSERASAVSDLFSFGSPDSIHRVGGSPLGVAAVLLLLLLLLYFRVSIFSGEDSGE